MRRYSPPYHSPPRRGYGGRGRSPPRRGYGGYGGGKDQNSRSLLVRNIPLNARAEDLRVPFERYGPVRDVYMPKDYYTGEPRGFAFVEFVDPYDASEAQYRMNGQRFGGRVITVVVAAETRKKPDEMRHRERPRGPSGHDVRRSYYGRSRSRSRSPRYPSSRNRDRSRSHSPAPRRRDDCSVSPRRRRKEHTRSPRDHPQGREEDRDRRSYSPSHSDANQNKTDNGYDDSKAYDAEGARTEWRSPRRGSRSPSGSRSRSADLSPRGGSR
ncbi:serine/arginine-rich SC35-like splicing factor SCL30 isoform X1 [Dioscorea cayenensis subsp. rotundata]|uniref:Serine/arginine-rich SC35-like splicing factor SCL30 isoform X1 n=1 Tax=Dioscorea cayennensis subsp. rotundata TaxID=55577 RepID=A0AB40BLQ8_DIOCR|nr:serine/arginine-rich SC35-like splicing factor SCL30 isoform X1 [Dioscorea cayenensis subsp. rotundata]